MSSFLKKKSKKKKSTLPERNASIILPSNPSELEQLLQAFQSENNSIVQQAEIIIKEFIKFPDAVGALMQQLMQSSLLGVRQLAAVLLRQSIKNLWSHLRADMHENIKEALLNLLVKETQRPVRISIAALISSLAKILIPQGQWNKLLEFLLECNKSNENALRQIAMMLFRALAENIPKALTPHFRTLQIIFTNGLSDNDEKVRIESLYALGALVDIIEQEGSLVTSFRDSIPPMIQLTRIQLQHYVAQHTPASSSSSLSSSVSDHDAEEVLGVCFEVFELMADRPMVLDHHMMELVQLMLEIVIVNTLEINLRDKASSMLCSIIQAKPNKLMKSNLVETVLKGAIALLVEAFDDENHTADETTPQKMGVDVFDYLVTNIPKSVIFGPSLQAIALLLQSGNPLQIKGALIMMAVLSESAAELMKEQLSSTMPIICQSLSSSNNLVRLNACVAIQQFSDYLQPEIQNYHNDFLPVVLRALENPHESAVVRQRLLAVLDAFCENAEATVLKAYVPDIMNKLVAQLQACPAPQLAAFAAEHKNSDDFQRGLLIQKVSIEAIRSIAQTMETEFTPYFQVTATLLAPYMQLSADELLSIRAKATDCMGMMASAVGKEVFAPLLKDCLTVVEQGLQMNYFELREASYVFYTSLCITLKEDFKPLLKTAMAPAIATCLADDGLTIMPPKQSELDDDTAYANLTDSENEAIDHGEEEGDDEDEERIANLAVHSGALDEKIAAVGLMTTIAKHAGQDFVYFIKECIQIMDEFSEYPHRFLRHANIQLIHEVLNVLRAIHPLEAHSHANPAPALHPDVEIFVLKLVSILIERLQFEEDKETAGMAGDALVAAIRDYGLAPIKPGWEHLCKALLMLLKEEAPSQAPTDDKDDDEEITKDHDELLIDSVTDIISVLAEVGGPFFEPSFKHLFQPLLRFYDVTRPSSDRSMCIGTLAEVSLHFGSHIQPYIAKILPLCIKALNDPSVGVRRNAAYLMGILSQTRDPQVIQSYPTALPLLQALYTIPTDINEANAAYAKAVAAAIAGHHAAQAAKAAKGKKKGKKVEPQEIDVEELTIDEKYELKDFYAARDNACSAICKMMANTPDQVPMQECMALFIAALPLQEDFMEAKHVYPAIFHFYSAHTAFIANYTPQIIHAFSQVFGNPSIDATLQTQLLELFKSLVKQMESQAQTIIAALPEANRNNLINFLNAPPPSASS